MIGLGLDGGGTGSRWRLIDDDGQVLGQGFSGPFTGHLFDEARRATAQGAVLALAADVRAIGRPTRIVAGITGLSAGSDTARLLASWLSAAFGLGTDAVQVTDDMRIAYRGAFVPGEGIMVYAGTGSVAIHLGTDDKVERAGGHGHLIDDAGGGFWIGQRALRAILHAQDEDRDGGALAQELAGAIGGSDWERIRHHVYGGGRAAVATLVPAVAKAAVRDDSVAAAILAAAGEELGRLARVLLARIGRQPVALAGGVTRASPLILAHFKAALPRDTTVRPITPTPVETAARLAAEGTWA